MLSLYFIVFVVFVKHIEFFFFFFFQADDGIRDADVTGVQTCALPILTDEPETTGPRGGERCQQSCPASRSPGRRTRSTRTPPTRHGSPSGRTTSCACASRG